MSSPLYVCVTGWNAAVRQGMSGAFAGESLCLLCLLSIKTEESCRKEFPKMPSPTAEKTLINYRTESGVAVIEMNDPPANAYSYEMNLQFDAAILKARMDNDVYVIVLTGAGEKFFSAGANIGMLNSVDATFKYYFCLQANE